MIVVAEKSIIVEPDTIEQALEDMMSIYFTFNIAYPKPLLVFIQHHIFGIKDDQMTRLLAGLHKLELSQTFMPITIMHYIRLFIHLFPNCYYWCQRQISGWE